LLFIVARGEYVCNHVSYRRDGVFGDDTAITGTSAISDLKGPPGSDVSDPHLAAAGTSGEVGNPSTVGEPLWL
jgi:hypothetical protein